MIIGGRHHLPGQVMTSSAVSDATGFAPATANELG
jgi:hypothetical protein